jgi:hypothetical protein
MGRTKLLCIFAIAGLSISLAMFPPLAYAGHGDNGGDNNHGHGGAEGNHHGHGHAKHEHGWDHKDYKEGKHHGHDYGEYGHPSYYGGPYFTSDRVGLIRNYYTPEEIDRLPPGLRKHLERTGHLPPGLEKKLVINQPLPPQYLDYMVPAPPELVSRLGPLPPDSNLYLYNGDAVLVNPRTMAVMDIVHGVLTLGGY